MLAYLKGSPVDDFTFKHIVSPRKLRLFALAWSRFFTSPKDVQRLQAIEIGEKYADGEATYDEVCAGWAFLGGQFADTTPQQEALEAAYVGAYDVGWGQDTDELCDRVRANFLRDIFGNPFRPAPFDAAWAGATAKTIARTIYERRAFDQMPKLAIALEEAGCDSPDILTHCHTLNEHVRGCWLLDLLLGKG